MLSQHTGYLGIPSMYNGADTVGQVCVFIRAFPSCAAFAAHGPAHVRFPALRCILGSQSSANLWGLHDFQHPRAFPCARQTLQWSELHSTTQDDHAAAAGAVARAAALTQQPAINAKCNNPARLRIVSALAARQEHGWAEDYPLPYGHSPCQASPPNITPFQPTFSVLSGSFSYQVSYSIQIP